MMGIWMRWQLFICTFSSWNTIFFYIQRYIAIYDYTAADDDEVSFNEGDIIVDATIIDEGWMEGRVQRSGQYGMLPSNYVEKI